MLLYDTLYQNNGKMKKKVFKYELVMTVTHSFFLPKVIALTS